jgi:hypothetical protein
MFTAGSILHSHRHENLKAYNKMLGWLNKGKSDGQGMYMNVGNEKGCKVRTGLFGDLHTDGKLT